MFAALLGVSMAVGSLNLDVVVAVQADYEWLAFYMPFTFMLYVIAAIAGKAPRGHCAAAQAAKSRQRPQDMIVACFIFDFREREREREKRGK